MRPSLIPALSLIAGLAVLLPSTDRGNAGGWPTPAAGLSRSGDPEVVFTFDDGPHEQYTGVILDTLAKHRVQGIFFWVGERIDDQGPAGDKRRALIPRAIREGHIIANHTSTHAQLCTTTEERAAREIDENRLAFASLAHMPVGLFRTPYGSRCNRLEEMLSARGLHHFHWDIDPQEWKHGSTKRTVAYVTSHLKRLQGRAVVLMHDIKRATAEALPKILEWIDAENERRRASGGRAIRIIPASQVVAEETMAHGLSQYLIEAALAVEVAAVEAVDALVP